MRSYSDTDIDPSCHRLIFRRRYVNFYGQLQRIKTANMEAGNRHLDHVFHRSLISTKE